MPLPEPLAKILRDNMTSNASKRHRALSPLLEAEVKLVVLDPCDARNIFLYAVSLHLDSLLPRCCVQLSLVLRDGLRLPLQSTASPPRTTLGSCLQSEISAMEHGRRNGAEWQPGHVKTRWAKKARCLIGARASLQLGCLCRLAGVVDLISFR
jgi:hypothetical protein